MFPTLKSGTNYERNGFMKSFIAWIGGKSLLAKRIVEEFPTDIERYVEVFGGGGSVLFSKDSHAPLEVYNDANSELVNLFRCMKYHREELEKEIDGYINSREVFQNIRVRLENGTGFTDIQRAGMFYVKTKISFGADGRTFCCNKRNLSTDRFKEIAQRLEKVVVENKDFENLIKVYDRPKALFYCDPPYHTTEKYYDVQFTEDDHLRLKSALDNIKGKFVLSYNDDEFIRELYRDYNIIEVTRQNNLSSGEYKEVIVKNF
jgi:DNA adenine methylase